MYVQVEISLPILRSPDIPYAYINATRHICGLLHWRLKIGAYLLRGITCLFP